MKAPQPSSATRAALGSTNEHEIVIVPFELHCRVRSQAEGAAASQLKLGINAQKTVEVVEEMELDPLPPNCAPFFAMMTLRGQPIPLLDLETVLRHEPTRAGEYPETSNEIAFRRWTHPRVVVCQTSGVLVGIPVDTTRRILRVDKSALLPVPGLVQSLPAGFATSIVRKGGANLYVLDVEAILMQLGVVVAPEVEASTEQILKGRHVMVVEDSVLCGRWLSSVCTSLGASHEWVEDGQAGLELFLSAKERFDLIITDIEMPRLDGLSMAARIRAESAVPIVFSSSISNTPTIKDIHDSGLGLYSVKFDLTRLLELLRGIAGTLSAPAAAA